MHIFESEPKINDPYPFLGDLQEDYPVLSERISDDIPQWITEMNRQFPNYPELPQTLLNNLRYIPAQKEQELIGITANQVRMDIANGYRILFVGRGIGHVSELKMYHKLLTNLKTESISPENIEFHFAGEEFGIGNSNALPIFYYLDDLAITGHSFNDIFAHFHNKASSKGKYAGAILRVRLLGLSNVALTSMLDGATFMSNHYSSSIDQFAFHNIPTLNELLPEEKKVPLLTDPSFYSPFYGRKSSIFCHGSVPDTTPYCIAGISPNEKKCAIKPLFFRTDIEMRDC